MAPLVYTVSVTVSPVGLAPRRSSTLPVPTIRFQILYVFLVLAHERRRIVHFAVTAHPTAEWTAHQLREAFPWDTAPRSLLRDGDRIFGHEFVNQVRRWASSKCC